MSRSSATSLMVRNASGALSMATGPRLGGSGAKAQRTHERGTNSSSAASVFRGGVGHVNAIDALLEDGRWLEHHDPARRDRHFLAGLRITSDPLTFLAHHERA